VHRILAEMKTILVVDDERNIVELVRLYLEKEGYAVVSARDGRTALELVERHDPDLVVLDLMLPGMDGLEVTRELRRMGETPIVMLTARGEDVDRIVGLELGADDYVVKPFNRGLVGGRAVLTRGRGEDARRSVSCAWTRADTRPVGSGARPAAARVHLWPPGPRPGVLSRDALLSSVWAPTSGGRGPWTSGRRRAGATRRDGHRSGPCAASATGWCRQPGTDRRG
jgi:CheY-like chemotaxis protein